MQAWLRQCKMLSARPPHFERSVVHFTLSTLPPSTHYASLRLIIPLRYTQASAGTREHSCVDGKPPASPWRLHAVPPSSATSSVQLLVLMSHNGRILTTNRTDTCDHRHVGLHSPGLWEYDSQASPIHCKERHASMVSPMEGIIHQNSNPLLDLNTPCSANV